MSNRCVVIHIINFFEILFCISLLLAICTPVCENGGTCTAPNTCECVDGYSGNQCQTGI